MSGGGFFGGGASQPSQTDVSQRAKHVNRSIRAIMIGQVGRATLETDDGPILVDGQEADEVVLCVAFLHTSEDGQRVTVSDSTGVMDCRLRGSVEVTEDMLRNYNTIVGRFRIFQGKIMFDINRIDTEIEPYQHLYHEVEAAREWFHYSGNLPLGQSLEGKATAGTETNTKQEEGLFVQDSSELSTEQRGLITSAIDSLSEENEATPALIAVSINLDEPTTRKFLDILEADGAIYTSAPGVYQVS